MDKKLTARNFRSGVEDFEALINKDLAYIDKTAQLDDLVHRAEVMLLLRPRRFGKTLTMSMLSCFLEMNYRNPEDRSRPERLFRDLDVYKNRTFCDEYMGRFPVISITLKAIEGRNFIEAMKEMLSLLLELFNKYSFLLKSSRQKEGNKLSLRDMIKVCSRRTFRLSNTDNMAAAISIAKNSLRLLSEMLHTEYDKKAVIIIDEYDVPLQKAKVNGYYDDMLKVIKGMLGNALKSNDSMETGFVTGCLRIAHQSIFTDINNFVCFGIGDSEFADFIGLTRDETAKLLECCGLESRLPDVAEWYDGYSFGRKSMMCPWSVLNFIGSALRDENPAAFQPQNYWANSSGNDIIDLCMRHPAGKDLDRLQNLLEGKTEEIDLREFTSYPEITSKTDFDTFATLMLHTGYLTAVKDATPSERNRAAVRIPNKEVLECFSEKAKAIFSAGNPEWAERAFTLLNALFAGDENEVQDIINDMLMSFISIRDASAEAFYHGFMTSALGIAAGTAGKGKNRINPVKMESQEDSGNGFSDIILSKVFEGKAVILEFKKCKTGTPGAFKKMCQEALKQIEKNKYEYRYRASGYQEILKYGIAFYGKGCLVIRTTMEPAG